MRCLVHENEPIRYICCTTHRLLCCKCEEKSKNSIAWDYRILKTRNRAKTLYEHFEYRFRFYRLVLLLQKLLLVCVALFVSQSGCEHCPMVGCGISIV